MKIKVILEGSETQEQAEEFLAKALEAKEETKLAHSEFADPLMEKVAQDLKVEFQEMQERMMDQILAVLDKV